jgi:group I intron endonuclease
MGILYKLTFSNGKEYIGVTVGKLKKRIQRHKQASLSAKQQAVHAAWVKHGEPKATLLAIVPNGELHGTEIRAIRVFATRAPQGYNLTAGGEGRLGSEVSVEARAKLREAGKKRMACPEARAKAGARNKGKTTSPEARAKMSVARKGKPKSLETRAKMSAAVQGHPVSLETRAKMSAAHKGKPKSPETLAKRAATRELNKLKAAK